MKKLLEAIRRQNVDHVRLEDINNLTYDSPVTHETTAGIKKIPKAISEDIAAIQ